MKNLIKSMGGLAAGFTILLGGVKAEAQQYVFAPLTFTNGTSMNGGTNNVKGGAAGTGGATNDYTSGALKLNYITLTKYADFALQITFTNDNPLATSNVLFNCQWSADATNWAVYGAFSIATAAGSTTVLITNPVVGAVGYFRVSSCVNTNGGAVTNLAMNFVTKPRRLGSLAPSVMPGAPQWQVAEVNWQSEAEHRIASLAPRTLNLWLPYRRQG